LRKAGIVIGILIVIAALYIFVPMNVYSRKLSMLTTGGNIIAENFSVPLLKFKLQIKASVRFVGALNISIVDPSTNDMIFSWEHATISEAEYDILELLDVSFGHKYCILITTVIGEFHIDIDITVYTIYIEY